MDQRAAKALERVKAAARPVTAVEVRCGRRGHLMASIHPLGDREFLVWRRPGRVIGAVRDVEEFQRDGAASPGLDEAGFGPMVEAAVIVDGPDAESPRAIFGIRSPVLGCACGRFTVDEMLADAIGAAIAKWWKLSLTGPHRPIVVKAT